MRILALYMRRGGFAGFACTIRVLFGVEAIDHSLVGEADAAVALLCELVSIVGVWATQERSDRAA